MLAGPLVVTCIFWKLFELQDHCPDSAFQLIQIASPVPLRRQAALCVKVCKTKSKKRHTNANACFARGGVRPRRCYTQQFTQKQKWHLSPGGYNLSPRMVTRKSVEGTPQPFGQRVEQVLKLTRASLRWGDTSGVQSPGEAWWPDGGLPDGGPGLNLESWGIDSGPAV